MSQQYQIQNYILGKPEFFDTIDLANERIKELESEVLVLNAARFNVVQIMDSHDGTMWIVPSENSPEDGTYMVFNSNFGTHEKIVGRTAAYNRNQQLKDEFLAELAQVPEIYIPPVQPSTTGTQTL
jgi:hypothetical protein